MTYDDFIAQWLSPQPYIEAHTSGSTGKPKPIRLLKDDMRASARATNAFFGIGRESMLVCPLSPDYIAGKMMAVRALEAACRIVFVEPSNAPHIPGEDAIDLLPVVPSQLASLLGQAPLLARVRNLLIGGAAPSAADCEALGRAGVRAYISYGMTETCSHVALALASDTDRVYRAMPGISFSSDGTGRLRIIAPEFSFGSLQTNDIVQLLDSSSFRWLGRADNVINSGGIKLFAERLEALYAPVMGGIPFYVTARADSKWGQAVEIVAETDTATLSHIAVRLAQQIADHRMLPKHYTAVNTIPRTANGKIKRIPS